MPLHGNVTNKTLNKQARQRKAERERLEAKLAAERAAARAAKAAARAAAKVQRATERAAKAEQTALQKLDRSSKKHGRKLAKRCPKEGGTELRTPQTPPKGRQQFTIEQTSLKVKQAAQRRSRTEAGHTSLLSKLRSKLFGGRKGLPVIAKPMQDGPETDTPYSAIGNEML